jgi:integrase
MFGWAICEGMAETNPTTNTNTYAGATARDRVLSTNETSAIWAALPDNDYGRIVKLLFYTGARPNEIGGLRWSEVLALKEHLIRLPGDRTKNGRAFDLPLSQPASELLAELERHRKDRAGVFGKRDGGFSGWSKVKRELDAKLPRVEPWQLRESALTHH